jgi:hypothetical protein
MKQKKAFIHTCAILLHVALFSCVLARPEQRLRGGRRCDAGKLLEGPPLSFSLVSPTWNFTKTWLPPLEKLRRPGGGIKCWSSPMISLHLQAEKESARPATWGWWHRLNSASTMWIRRWKTLRSSPTTHSGRELPASSPCEKPIPLQPDRHPATLATFQTSARSSNGLLASRHGLDSGGGGGSAADTLSMMSSMSVDESAPVLASASTTSL